MLSNGMTFLKLFLIVLDIGACKLCYLLKRTQVMAIIRSHLLRAYHTIISFGPHMLKHFFAIET